MNENCLLGFQCPRCGCCGPFYIEAKTVVLVYDDGTENVDGELDWGDESYCECHNCHHFGTVKDFTTA
jgi:hypothetical protein